MSLTDRTQIRGRFGGTIDRVLALLAPLIPIVVGASVLLVTLGTVGALLARRSFSQETGSMRPTELARMVGDYESVLLSVREGLILTDDRARVRHYRSERSIYSELGVPPSIAALIETRARIVKESHLAGDPVLLVNHERANRTRARSGTPQGRLTMFRDLTEVKRLSGELESVCIVSDALRWQAHEWADRLPSVMWLLELGRTHEAIELIAQKSETSQPIVDDLVGACSEPALARPGQRALHHRSRRGCYRAHGHRQRGRHLPRSPAPHLPPGVLDSAVGYLGPLAPEDPT